MPPSDLPRRVGVALVGIPAVLGLLYLGGWWITVPVAALAAGGAWEAYRLAEAGAIRPLRLPGMAAAAFFVLAAGAVPEFASFAPWALGGVLALAGVALVLLLGRRKAEDAPLEAGAVTLFGAVYGGLPLAFVPLLYALPGRWGWEGAAASPWAGTWIVVLPLACTWVGDAAAYFAGSAWGRKKLAPAISPKKSWVGAWAGLAAAAAAAAVWGLLVPPVLPVLPMGAAALAGVGVVLGVGAQVGDLAESLFKRGAGVKDSGTFFGAHGGILDRLDALTFTLPLAYLFLTLPEVLP